MSQELMLIFALFGVVYGVVLQRTNFCFAYAAFELFYLRTRDAVNGVLVGLLVTTLGFGVVAAVRLHAGLSVADHLLSPPIGIGTLLGSIIFGFGMTIAGMCAVGTLLRIGEGYLIGWVVLAGLLSGAATYPFQAFTSGAPAVSLTNWVSPLIGSILTFSAILLLWFFSRYKRRQVASPRNHISLPARLRKLPPVVIGGVLLGLVNTAQMAVAMPWTAGYPLAMIPSLFSHSPAVSKAAVAPPLALNIGLVLGALLSGVAQRNFRFSYPRRKADFFLPLLGGLLMGWGIRAAHGCNLGGFFSAIPSLVVSGWIYLLGLLIGAWLGTKVITAIR